MYTKYWIFCTNSMHWLSSVYTEYFSDCKYTIYVYLAGPHANGIVSARVTSAKCGGAVALYSLCCIICNKTASLALNVRKKVAFEVKQNIFTLLVDMESLYWLWSKGFVFLREICHERI